MARRRGKYHYKVDKLRGFLSVQDQAEFDNLCQFNPSYSTLQSWFGERGYKVSINAICHWWKASYPDRDESKILKGIAIALGQDFDKPPFNSASKLVAMASQVLTDHLTGRLANVETQTLLTTQIELFRLARSLSITTGNQKTKAES